MYPRDSFYRITPKVVRTGRRCRIRVEPLFEHVTPPADAELTAMLAERDTRSRHPLVIHRKGRALEMLFTPAVEQEYVIILSVTRNGETHRWEEFPIYAVDPDLFSCRPWKGDVHMHSSRSDGREEPVYVAAACRRIGLDFMALTDHRVYAPSLEAREAFLELDLDFTIFPGEEVHPPDNPVHIVNFGGRRSVNLLAEDSSTYKAEVAALEDGLDVDLSKKERWIYASCVWAFNKIREGGGVGILCHPYWITGDAYNVSQALQEVLYREKPFDALEIIGGYYRHEMESNALAVTRWQEERAAGRRMPVVGVSDAHGCERGELFGWYYTILFSPTTEYVDLHQAILAEKSIAVEAVAGEFPRLYGPLRLVKYAYFLLREVIPAHDRLCVEEGRLMANYIVGEEGAEERLRSLQGRIGNLYRRFWGA